MTFEIKTRGPYQLPLSNEEWEMLDGTPQRVYDRLNRLLALVLSSVTDAQEAQDTMAPVLDGYRMHGAMDTEPRIVLTLVMQQWYGVDDDVIDYTGFDYAQLEKPQ